MTAIEWTDQTWNPIVGCSVVSPGCANCYAMKMAARIEAMNYGAHVKHAPTPAAIPPSPYDGLTSATKAGAVWNGKVAEAGQDKLLAPLSRKKPTRYFVNSMGDLFHEAVPDAWIDRVFAVMALSPQHTFQVLTKRSKRMREYLTRELAGPWAGRIVRVGWQDDIARPETDAAFRVRGVLTEMLCEVPGEALNRAVAFMDDRDGGEGDGFFRLWPLPNVHLGVSCERQQEADERIPDLLATPAAIRFVSAEPLLGEIDFTRITMPRDPGAYDALRGAWTFDLGGTHGETTRTSLPRLDWIIVGGESGVGARPNWTPNVRSIVKQCAAADVACFVKQLGANVEDRDDAGFEGCEPHEWPDVDFADVDYVNPAETYQGAAVRIRLRDRKGGDMGEWPEDMRVRQFPRATLLPRAGEGGRRPDEGEPRA